MRSDRNIQKESGRDARGPDGTRIRTAGVPPAITTAAEAEVRWHSRGYLPHVDAPHLVQHVIFRLADSLPVNIRSDLAAMPRAERLRAGDAVLDQGFGANYLKRPAIALMVQDAFLRFDKDRYTLLAWCIMPNHAHVLLQLHDHYGLDRVVHSWKSYSSKAANRMLARAGTFWAPEYFDRFMRDENQLARTAAYIEANPVRAGLCKDVSDWRFSSASEAPGGRDARGPDARQSHGEIA